MLQREGLPHPDAANTFREATSAGTTLTIFFAAGTVLAAVGVTLYLVAPKERASASVQIGPSVAMGTAGMNVGADHGEDHPGIHFVLLASALLGAGCNARVGLGDPLLATLERPADGYYGSGTDGRGHGYHRCGHGTGTSGTTGGTGTAGASTGTGTTGAGGGSGGASGSGVGGGAGTGQAGQGGTT